MITMEKKKVGIVGCTGMVGQRFITLLADHPMFEISAIAASERSSGKTYVEAVGGRWKMKGEIPAKIAEMTVMNAADVKAVAAKVDFILCAVDMKKDEIKALEEAYAKAEVPVVSNNSANRWTPDVPMVIPEINPEHFEVIEAQKTGRLNEAFGTGTAAVISPIGELYDEGTTYVVNNNEIGAIAQRLYSELYGMQTGKVEDYMKWTYPIKASL